MTEELARPAALADAGAAVALECHTLTPERTLEVLGSDAAVGISGARAEELLDVYGKNELRPAERTPRWRMFVAQFNDFMIWVLLVAVAISAIEGQVAEAVAIMAILILNGVLGFVQEYRAEQALEALKEMSAPTASVIRDGVELEIPADTLVPGDIVLLEAGDRIPADGRILESAALRTEEAALTGESVPVSKRVDYTCERDAGIADRPNLVYAGTTVAVGRGRFVVTATGQATEMGRIAQLLSEQEEEKTPLQEELRTVGKVIALAVLAIAVIVFAEEVWRALLATGLPLEEALASDQFRESITLALLVAVSLAVAAIPEGLPAIVTVALSLGVRTMASHNAIVRKLHAVETLGSTTFICSDKTGTLTRNAMVVRKLVVGTDTADVTPDYGLESIGPQPFDADLRLLLEIAASCNDARYSADGKLLGDPTETALVVAADRMAPGLSRPERIGEVPFDSERKRMTTVHDVDGRRVAYVKGGTDVLLELCTHALIHGNTVEMTDALHSQLLEANEELAAGGQRTLAVAMRELEENAEIDEGIETDLTYVGIVGLLDPPRPEVAAAIDECHRAGIHVAMVTGDHALTARAIGDQIGSARRRAGRRGTRARGDVGRRTLRCGPAHPDLRPREPRAQAPHRGRPQAPWRGRCHDR